MERSELLALLDEVSQGRVPAEEAARRIGTADVAKLEYATLDLQRGVRQGVSEVVYGAGKTAEQIAGIVGALVQSGQARVMVTRLDQEKAAEIQSLLENDTQSDITLAYHEQARMGIVGDKPAADSEGTILVACAGTSDLPVAEEAALTAEMLGNRVVRAWDVGVAGIHRLLRHADDIADANVIVAVAGMEGALPSVVAGLASCPVIAVPTSVGYGASFGGVTALLAMLNSCASGVSVVNIDNGFGAGYQASLINHRR